MFFEETFGVYGQIVELIAPESIITFTPLIPLCSETRTFLIYNLSIAHLC